MHKSRIVLVSLALVLMLALLIPLVGCGGGGEAVPCKISSVSGDVQVLRSGSTESVKATNGMELAVGDTITTGSDGSAKLTFFEGSVMEIKANSKIAVNELSTASTGSTSVSLKETVGSTVNRVAKLVDSASKYEVETPAAVAVVRGTVFDMLVKLDGFTTLKSEEGSVSFTGGNKTWIVKAGEQSTAAVGEDASAPIASATTTTTQASTPTPVKTSTSTSTSTSGQTLSDIYGKSGYTGDVKYDVFMTAGGMSQQLMYKTYYKGWNSTNPKVRYETPPAYPGGYTQVTIWDSSTRTNYLWYPDQHVACQVPTGQGKDNPQGNDTQIIPTYQGTDTVDSKLCDVYKWTFGDSTMKEWIWKEELFPIKQEITTSGQTATYEYQNIVFGTLSNDLFTVPSNEIKPYPCYPMPSISYPYST